MKCFRSGSPPVAPGTPVGGAPRVAVPTGTPGRKIWRCCRVMGWVWFGCAEGKCCCGICCAARGCATACAWFLACCTSSVARSLAKPESTMAANCLEPSFAVPGMSIADDVMDDDVARPAAKASRLWRGDESFGDNPSRIRPLAFSSKDPVNGSGGVRPSMEGEMEAPLIPRPAPMDPPDPRELRSPSISKGTSSPTSSKLSEKPYFAPPSAGSASAQATWRKFMSRSSRRSREPRLLSTPCCMSTSKSDVSPPSNLSKALCKRSSPPLMIKSFSTPFSRPSMNPRSSRAAALRSLPEMDPLRCRFL
mmetsp:Transcript_9966/g.28330  ORF Transcript_9966/g.28330 Transcript_9966/m.28330 type:complete len:307 (-) Transcript_9966:314-1234(-)